MHAYLINGNDNELLTQTLSKLKTSTDIQVLEFIIEKIAQVRELQHFLSLSYMEQRLVVIKNIDKASVETLNAFLKILEEPLGNVTFIMTTKSKFLLPETITSRCIVISGTYKNKFKLNPDTHNGFLDAPLLEKIKSIDSIKKREDALTFIYQIIEFCFYKLHSDKVNYVKLSKIIQIAQKAYLAIEANGNINLHLSVFTFSIDQLKVD